MRFALRKRRLLFLLFFVFIVVVFASLHRRRLNSFVDRFLVERKHRLSRVRFLRRCAEEKVRFLVVSEQLVRSVESRRNSTIKVQSLTLSLTKSNSLSPTDFPHLAVFRHHLSLLQRILSEPEFGPNGKFRLDARAIRGAPGVEKAPLSNAATSKAPSKILYGFSIHDGTRNRFDVSVIYERRASKDDAYFWMPWSPRGVAMAFPAFETRPVAVEGFGETFQSPANATQFLWESESAEFVRCDAERNAGFASKSLEAVMLNATMDEARIKRSMGLIVALRKTMSNWRKRNWITSGTLLGWYRQCSLIPYDRDMDTAQWIDDYEPWMIQHFVDHPILKLYVKFGIPEDSLEFKMGDRLHQTIDLFWMYPYGRQSWVGFQVFDSKYTKMIALYPLVGRICSADLHGYLVYVPCDAWSVIRTQYGENLFEQNPGHDYTKDGHNYRSNGTWSKLQWEGGEVYKVYQ